MRTTPCPFMVWCSNTPQTLAVTNQATSHTFQLSTGWVGNWADYMELHIVAFFFHKQDHPLATFQKQNAHLTRIVHQTTWPLDNMCHPYLSIDNALVEGFHISPQDQNLPHKGPLTRKVMDTNQHIGCVYIFIHRQQLGGVALSPLWPELPYILPLFINRWLQKATAPSSSPFSVKLKFPEGGGCTSVCLQSVYEWEWAGAG